MVRIVSRKQKFPDFRWSETHSFAYKTIKLRNPTQPKYTFFVHIFIRGWDLKQLNNLDVNLEYNQQ